VSRLSAEPPRTTHRRAVQRAATAWRSRVDASGVGRSGRRAGSSSVQHQDGDRADGTDGAGSLPAGAGREAGSRRRVGAPRRGMGLMIALTLQLIAVTHVTVIDMTGAAPKRDMTVVVERAHVAWV